MSGAKLALVMAERALLVMEIAGTWMEPVAVAVNLLNQ